AGVCARQAASSRVADLTVGIVGAAIRTVRFQAIVTVSLAGGTAGIGICWRVGCTICRITAEGACGEYITATVVCFRTEIVTLRDEAIRLVGTRLTQS